MNKNSYQTSKNKISYSKINNRGHEHSPLL